MDLSFRYKKKEQIILREESDGAFLFDPDTGNLKYMNQSALEIFQFMENQNSVGQIIDLVKTQYPDADAEQVRKDVETFLATLQAQQFIASQTA